MTPDAMHTISGMTEDDTTGAVSIEIAPDAAEYLREKGGFLYLWVSKAGLLDAKTTAPAHSERWSWHKVDGVRVAIGESASEPTAWTVLLRHIPWKHLDVMSNLNHGSRMAIAP